MTNSYKEIIENYWYAANNRDWETFEDLLHEDILYELPQTKERIRGRVAFREFNAAYPGDWMIEIVRLVDNKYQAASQISFRTNGEERLGSSFFEFKDGLIHRIVEYWPNPYKFPVRQSHAVEYAS